MSGGTTIDPCAPTFVLGTLLQAAIGDDWGWSFIYLDASNQPITFGGDTVQGQLYTPFVAAPTLLDASSGRAQVIDTPTLSFALGLEKAVTKTLSPDVDPPVTHLQIQRVDVTGLIRSIGHISLQLLPGNVTPQPTQQIGYADPVTGEKVVLTGYSTQVPFVPAAFSGSRR